MGRSGEENGEEDVGEGDGREKGGRKIKIRTMQGDGEMGVR